MTRRSGVFAVVCFLVAINYSLDSGAVDAYWDLPTTYSDGSAIPSAMQGNIVTNLFTGDYATGPWTPVASSSPGATYLTGINLHLKRGGNCYLTTTATLNGTSSAYAPAVAYTNQPSPGKPGNIKLIFK